MAGEPPHDGAPWSRIDGHKLSEFIYGTIIGMVAVAGIDGGDGTSWLEAAAAIVAGAAAIWVAHAYAVLLSRRVVAGHRLAARDLGEALAGSWPIVTAGVILALPLLPVALGVLVARLRPACCKRHRPGDACAHGRPRRRGDQGDMAAPCADGCLVRGARVRHRRHRVRRSSLESVPGAVKIMTIPFTICTYRTENRPALRKILEAIGWAEQYVVAAEQNAETFSGDLETFGVYVAVCEERIVGFVCVQYSAWNQLAQLQAWRSSTPVSAGGSHRRWSGRPKRSPEPNRHAASMWIRRSTIRAEGSSTKRSATNSPI